MKRVDAYGREVEDEPYLSQIDYASLLRPGVTAQQRTQTLHASPLAAAAPSMTGAPTQAPASQAQQRAPVAGSRFVDYGYLFGLNQGKAQQSAARMTARAEAAAAEAEARLKGAQSAFAEKVKEGSGTDYTGQEMANPNPGKPGLPVDTSWRRPFGSRREKISFGTSRQGLTGTPQRAYLTPEKVAELAAQEYGGPSSLIDLPGYDELTAATLGAQTRATSLGTQEGLQALLAEDNAGLGGYGTLPTGTSGKSRWDAAMLGSAGGDNFRELAKRYGGLVKGLESANVASAADVDKARVHTAAEAAEWKAMKEKASLKKEPIELPSVGYGGVVRRFDDPNVQREHDIFLRSFKESGGDEGLYDKLDAGDRVRLSSIMGGGGEASQLNAFVTDMRRKHG